jgi:hypothetical protein
MTFAPCSKCSAIVSKNRLLGTPAICLKRDQRPGRHLGCS